MAVCGVSDVLIVKKGFEIISHKIIANHYFSIWFSLLVIILSN
jgi:hypothetical protein